MSSVFPNVRERQRFGAEADWSGRTVRQHGGGCGRRRAGARTRTRRRNRHAPDTALRQKTRRRAGPAPSKRPRRGTAGARQQGLRALRILPTPSTHRSRQTLHRLTPQEVRTRSQTVSRQHLKQALLRYDMLCMQIPPEPLPLRGTFWNAAQFGMIKLDGMPDAGCVLQLV